MSLLNEIEDTWIHPWIITWKMLYFNYRLIFGNSKKFSWRRWREEFKDRLIQDDNFQLFKAWIVGENGIMKKVMFSLKPMLLFIVPELFKWIITIESGNGLKGGNFLDPFKRFNSKIMMAIEWRKAYRDCFDHLSLKKRILWSMIWYMKWILNSFF